MSKKENVLFVINSIDYNGENLEAQYWGYYDRTGTRVEIYFLI